MINILGKPETEYREITYSERSEFYEVEHATNMDAAFLGSLLTREIKSVLEVPCGVGRNVFLFARKGLDVLGVDLNPQMIERAEARLIDDQLSKYKSNVEFRQGDIRSLSLSRSFDLVVVPVEAFRLLDTDADAIKALWSLGRCVSPDGSMLIDLAKFGDRKLSSTGRPAFYAPDEPDGKIIWEWTRPLPHGGWLTRLRRQFHDGRKMKFRFYFGVSQGGNTRHLFTDLVLRMYEQNQIENLIRSANLKILSSFGDHSGAPSSDRSARLIYRLRPICGYDESSSGNMHSCHGDDHYGDVWFWPKCNGCHIARGD